ncbi:MAG: hypothetical protein Q8P20_09270 [bacterium]|nr:hypothetical protein [bacterium]
MPKTRYGKWSVYLIGLFIIFLLIFYALIASGQRGGDTFFSNWALTIPILLAGICGIAGFVTGLIAILKQRERSVLVYVAVVIGALATFFATAEIIFPH